ncbi:fimbria/pilus outer membrane usher protein [Stenotrophomonas maltophilia]|uniref:fimbria/pilus outer membrane usher protein n=1 Tax=Stenotrophomonas TaxID=40323 RepID=UPI001EF93519|nr:MULTISPECIES: fimbria/pilus outer membrane usher protein [Stenotrophomonas]MDG9988097.1 fimbrial biogenesis outer membrane usher protein [Stenotrophomonas sp. GD04024]
MRLSSCSCQRATQNYLRHTALAAAITTALVFAAALPAYARTGGEVKFSEGFASGFVGEDLARFSMGNPVEPGRYNVDIHLNGEFVRRDDIELVASSTPYVAKPCVPAELLLALGLSDAARQAVESADTPQCIDLEALIDGARVRYDDSQLRLDISLPQVALQRQARGFVAPELRDQGITAAFFGYNVNHYRSQGQQNSYAGITTGVNLGAWRLRHRSSLSHSPQGTHFTTLNSTLQRDLPRWNSQLTLGQANTGGELFDSVGFTGVRITTDERMLPDSLRGYAPVVRGVAQSNARVTILQNGAVLYQTTVAPGPFAIDDLYPNAGSGDLEAAVTEADGREERFTVAFSAVPQALREGSQRFSITAGELRDTGMAQNALRFTEGTYARGVSNRMTLLGGVQVAEHYQAGLAGAAFNTPFGAIGADITHARANVPGLPAQSGRSYRLNYQRSVARTGTNLGLAAYRYSTEGFLTLTDVSQLSFDRPQAADAFVMRTRQRFQVNFSQRVGQRSQIYLSGGHVAYWNRAGKQNDLQLGFHSSYRSANYTLSATRYRMANGAPDTRLSFMLSVPLGRSTNAPRATATYNDSRLGSQQQLGINGNLGEERALSYSLSGNRGQGSSGYNAYASYQGSRADLSAGYSHANGRSSFNAGVTGSVVLHRGGINFGPSLGESFALVEALGAQGAKVGSGRSVTVAGNGYAVLPYTSPYRWNQVQLDTADLPLDVEVQASSQRVAPSAGSIVKVSFQTRNDRLWLIDASDAQGQPLPYGAQITHPDGRVLGQVGQGGVMALRGLENAGLVHVQTEDGIACRLHYAMPETPDAQGQYWAQARCVAPGPELLADDVPSSTTGANQ